jgi:RNA ligase
MLKINDINEFRSKVSHKEEIREMDIGEGCTSFCYMVAAEGTFDDAWSRECRGIVFNTSLGTVAARPLHKFFNVGEREETRVENLDWSKVVRVMDKRDGSMIHTAWTMNGLRLKSKKSFDSDVAKAAEDWMHSQPGLNVFKFCTRMQAMNKTAIFEWTAPDARIVLFYPEAELRLLHVRDNESGEYMHPEDLRKWAAEFGVSVVDEVDEFDNVELASPDEMSQLGVTYVRSFDFKRLMDAAKTREGVEGWIVQFENGDMVKVKTDWYLKRHRAMTFLRERDIAQLVLDEGLDDMKSLLVGEGVDISEILKIEAEVVRQINEVRSWVDGVIAKDGKMDRKEFALQYQKSHNEYGWFGLLMARFSGKEPDYQAWYERNALKEKWSLRQLSLVPSVAEAE